MAAQLNATVVLFQAIAPSASETGGASVDVNSAPRVWQASGYLVEVARRISPTVRHLAVRTGIGYSAAAIARASIETGSDLIVLATHGPNDAPRIAVGSVATAVLRLAAVPLTLVRPDTLCEPRPQGDHIGNANESHDCDPPSEMQPNADLLLAV